MVLNKFSLSERIICADKFHRKLCAMLTRLVLAAFVEIRKVFKFEPKKTYNLINFFPSGHKILYYETISFLGLNDIHCIYGL